MAVSTDNRMHPIASAEREFSEEQVEIPPVRTGMNQSSQGSRVFYIFAAFILLAGGYYIYNSYAGSSMMTPDVVQTSPAPVTAVPQVDAPAQTAPVATPADGPLTPPAEQKTP